MQDGGCLNDRFFAGKLGDQMKWLARGWDERGRRFRGGITSDSLQQIKVRRGAVLFRFGHSNLPPERNLSSPWWMESGALLELGYRAQESDADITWLARTKLAIASDFGVADTLFWVEVKAKLRAWAGKGFPVWEEEGARQANPRLPTVWLGDAQVMQIFIPGLRNPDGTLSEIARNALHVLPHRPATQWQSLTKGGFKSAVWPNS